MLTRCLPTVPVTRVLFLVERSVRPVMAGPGSRRRVTMPCELTIWVPDATASVTTCARAKRRPFAVGMSVLPRSALNGTAIGAIAVTAFASVTAASATVTAG
jgi:hypothetical protein